MISIDSILKNSENKDLTPIQLALDNFNDISLISMYSDVISAEDLDMLNNRELTQEEWKDLKWTITTIQDFKKSKWNGSMQNKHGVQDLEKLIS